MTRRSLLTAGALLQLLGCPAPGNGPASSRLLISDDFNGENEGVYSLNYEGFAQWEVAAGSVDLIGTPPFHDFLPPEQKLYVDLDGTTHAGGVLRTRREFDLAPGLYRLRFKMSGCPRPHQPPNTVVVSLGEHYREAITLPSYAPLRLYLRTVRVRHRSAARLQFQHLGGDNYGSIIDDVRLERL